MGWWENRAHIFAATVNFSKKLQEILSRKEGMIVYSPFGVHEILSFLYQGTDGETARDLQRTLDLLDIPSTSEGYRTLLHKLENNHTRFLNDIVIPQQYKVKDEVLESLCMGRFVSTTTCVSRVDEGNEWLERCTRGKFKKIISSDDLKGDIGLVLANVLYIREVWVKEFYITKIRRFYVSETEIVLCDVMRMTEKLKYGFDEDLNSQIVCLPYRNNQFSLFIILPQLETGIKNLESKFHTKDLSQLNEALYEAEVTLLLPKFKFETTIDLSDSLNELGLGSIFCNAELSKILDSSEPLRVSQVIQKVILNVNESGTGIPDWKPSYGSSSEEIKKSLQKAVFNANHPFLFCFCYNLNNLLTPLCVGIDNYLNFLDESSTAELLSLVILSISSLTVAEFAFGK